MSLILKKRAFLFAAVIFAAAVGAVSVFAQSESAEEQAGEREQGLFTGEPIWRQALGGTVLSLPDVQVQSAVAALDGGNIRAYSSSGTPMWNYSARGRISPYVTRSREGTSYFSRTNGTLIAVNRAGRELWRRGIDSPLAAKVIPGWDGRLFVPAEKKIFCFTASGNLLWTKTFRSNIFLPPKLDHSGGIIFALENNEVCRIDAFGNTRIWTLSNKPAVLLSIEAASSNMPAQTLVLYADGTMGFLGQTEDWFFSAQGDTHSSVLPRLPGEPAAAASRGNNFAVVFSNGMVSVFSLEEKRIIWSGESHIREIIKSGVTPVIGTEILFDERGVYVLSRNGASGFSHNGKRLWYTILQNTAAIPALGNDGVLYSGGKDWILYAYKIEERALPEKRSLYGPLPDGSYGTDRPRMSNVTDFPINEFELAAKLEQIKTGLNAGAVGSNELAWVSTLMIIASGGSGGNGFSDYHIRYRLEALRLLGQIGSRETVPWLVNFFRMEIDPALKAAAANAVGSIGVDPEGSAIQTFAFLLVNGGGIKDEQVLLSIVSATSALCRFSGPPLSESGIKILTLLSANNQPSVVRQQAQREIARLR